MASTSLPVILAASLVVGAMALRLRTTTRTVVSGCQDKQGRWYKVGETVNSLDPCEMCSCASDGSILCAIVDCLPCHGRLVPVEGQCCGDCYVNNILILPGVGCKRDNTVYEYGSRIPTDDPCETCRCHEIADIMCAIMACMPCPPFLQHVSDGSCCGACIDNHTEPVIGEEGCDVNGNHYNVGERIPGETPCETCYCGPRGSPDCLTMACEPCPPDTHRVDIRGTCCGECAEVSIQPVVDGCDVKGTHYDVGPFTFTDLRGLCKDCMCNEDGTFSCAKKKCPKLKCKQSLITSVEGQCCPVCQCEHDGEIYMPGPVPGVCESLVCENGEVTVSQPARCEDMELKCVNPQISEDCCPYCPNGITCQLGKTIISVGEFKKVGKKICTCYADPWFPNAFCAAKKVNFNLKKKYGEYLADFNSLLQEVDLK